MPEPEIKTRQEVALEYLADLIEGRKEADRMINRLKKPLMANLPLTDDEQADLADAASAMRMWTIQGRQSNQSIGAGPMRRLMGVKE